MRQILEDFILNDAKHKHSFFYITWPGAKKDANVLKVTFERLEQSKAKCDERIKANFTYNLGQFEIDP